MNRRRFPPKLSDSSGPSACAAYRFHLLFFLLCLVFLLLRGWDRLAFAQMWAEDAIVFVGQAYEVGWQSLLEPYGGYFHTFPRLVGILASLLPDPALVPYFIAAVCYVAFAFVAAEITRAEYDWVVRGRWARGALALLLCLLPGMEEVLGNLANIHWVLFAWLALLGLRDPRRSFSLVDGLMVLLAVSSEGMIVLLLPLFLYRAWYVFRHRPDGRGLSQESAVVLLIVFFTLVNFLVKESRSHIDWGNLSEPVAISLYSAVKYQVLSPWLGYHGLQLLQQPSLFIVVGTVVSCLVLWWGFRLKNRHWLGKFWILLLFLLAFAGVPALVWVVRPGNAEIFLLHSEWLWQFRYAFIATFAGFVLWMSLLSSAQENFRFTGLALFLLLNLAMAAPRISIEAYGKEQYWVQQAPMLRQSLVTGCPEKVSIPIYPVGWTFTYESPIPCTED